MFSHKNKRKKQAEKATATITKTNGNKQKIVTYIQENGASSSSELAEYLGLSTARTRVLLSEMISERKLQPVGNGRSRRYIDMSE